MGINQFNPVFEKYINFYKTYNVDCKQTYKIVVDGNLVLHKGAHSGATNPEVIANQALEYLNGRIQFLTSLKINFDQIAIYFDGTSPNLKTFVKNTRKRYVKFNVKEALNCFKEQCATIGYNIIQLEDGESEVEMITNNINNYALILITTDTDVYNLTYKRCDRPVYLLLKNYFIKLHEFTVADIGEKCMSIIWTLMGTDYSQPLLTRTMISSIIESKSCFDLSRLFKQIERCNLKNSHDWKFALGCLFRILEYGEVELKFKTRNFIKNSDTTGLTLSMEKIDKLTANYAWIYRYKIFGRKVDNFKENDNGFLILTKGEQKLLIQHMKTNFNFESSVTRKKNLIQH